jgi:hypothetical protein
MVIDCASIDPRSNKNYSFSLVKYINNLDQFIKIEIPYFIIIVLLMFMIILININNLILINYKYN